MKSPVQFLESLFDDVKRLYPDVRGLDRDLLTIKSRVLHEGDSFLTITLPALGKAFDKGLEEGEFRCPSAFKRRPRESLPRFLSGLTSDVFNANGSLKEVASVCAVKHIREILYLFRKMQLSSDREEILDQKAKTAFFALDAKIPSQESIPAWRLSQLKQVCKFLLPNLDCFEELDYRHGPGSVHEGYTSNQKWSAVYNGLLEGDHRLLLSGLDLVAYAQGYIPKDNPHEQTLSGSAKLVTVAKNSVSRRTITVEPCLSQFVQQGLNKHLRSEILRCSVLSRCLSLSDQKPNQELALIGSRTGRWATLDLSSASDLLGLYLVREVFASHPRFLEAMEVCRSSEVEANPFAFKIRKFAGMGNALTFPVQSVVFAAIAIAAQLTKVWEKRIPTFQDVKRAAKHVRVYGDDIIVEADVYHQVVDWLSCLGLSVNQDKSFHRGKFRESCGVDAYAGANVTPVYVRQHPVVTSKDAKALENLVSASNQFWLLGLYSISKACSDNVEEALGCALPLVHPNSSCLGLITRQKHYDFHRWNSQLHRFEVRAYVGSSKYRDDPIDGYPALLKFFLTPLLERQEGHLQRSSRRFTLSHRKRWTQAG